MTTAAWQSIAERVGGGVCHLLFDLTVSHPTPYTWHLAPVDLVPSGAGTFDPDVFDPGTFATGLSGTLYWGLIKEHSGMSAAASVGGVGGTAGITLTIINAIGTGGPGRRFTDAFVTNVPGYSEPYDLLTATLHCRIYWESIPTVAEPLSVGTAMAIQPQSFQWSESPGQPQLVQLTFGPDVRRYHNLPRKRVTKTRYPHAPDNAINQPIVPWFGSGLRVPLTSLDSDGGTWLVGASPTDTPLNAVSRLWTVRTDPSATESSDKPIAFPVKITTAAQAVLSITQNGTDNVTLKQIGQRFELDSDGAFVYAVRLRLRRSVAGTPCVGSITVAIVTDEDGLPGETLVDRNASAEVTAAIVSTGAFADYDIPFQANKLSRPAYVMPNRGLWLVVKYAKTSGDMQINTDSTGAYAKGFLATKDTATDSQWILTGRQQRRSTVRQDFTGIGQLGKNRATGVITRRGPVTIPGT